MRRLLILLSLLFLSAPALAATAPSLKEAEALLKKGQLDELMVAFHDLEPGQHPAGDQKVAALLVRAAQAALKQGDGFLALDIASKAMELDSRNLDAYLAAADGAMKIGNDGFARKALQQAQLVSPDNPKVSARLARLGEVSAPPVSRGDRGDTAVASAPPAPAVATSADDELNGVPGYASRPSDHFRIIYSEGGRDFAQKAEYEQRCLDLFERAYQKVTTRLGTAPSGKTDVVLYTKQEFQLHFGGSFGNGVLGFYAGKIRMNRAENIDDAFFNTAVHEFTHAVVDSMAHGHSGRIPTWLNEGLARWVERRTAGQDLYGYVEKVQLQRMAVAHTLPALSTMAHVSFAAFGNSAWIAYATSAVAVDQLMARGPGLVGLERVIDAAGSGTPFESAFAAEFGSDCLAGLDADIASTLAG